MADLPRTVWSLCDTTDLAPYDVCNLWNSVNSTGYVRHKALFILFYFLGAVCRRRYHQTYHGRPPPNGLVAVQHNEGPYDVCNLWNSVNSTGYIRHKAQASLCSTETKHCLPTTIRDYDDCQQLRRLSTTMMTVIVNDYNDRFFIIYYGSQFPQQWLSSHEPRGTSQSSIPDTQRQVIVPPNAQRPFPVHLRNSDARSGTCSTAHPKDFDSRCRHVWKSSNCTRKFRQLSFSAPWAKWSNDKIWSVHPHNYPVSFNISECYNTRIIRNGVRHHFVCQTFANRWQLSGEGWYSWGLVLERVC